MHPIDSLDARKALTSEPGSHGDDSAALKDHLKEIIEGKAFKGSSRSIRLLEYILDQTIAGHFDALKERVIGVEVFGRSPSYETGEDSIVRVAAGDVRKRLMQHYAMYGTNSGFRLSLPLGSYVLEITRCASDETGVLNAAKGHDRPAARSPEQEASHPALTTATRVAASQPEVVSESARAATLGWRMWLAFSVLILAAGVAGWTVSWSRFSHEKVAKTTVLPWPAFFGSPHNTVLITSDPNIAEIEILAGRQISASDYANHRYIPEPNKMTPEETRFSQEFLTGDKAASIDTPIAVNIAQLAQANSRALDVRSARSIQLTDLHTDDDFIFLGSPRSNPWVSLYTDQLDFRIVPNNGPGDDRIVNSRPQPHELSVYVPAAPGYATGQSLAIVAFVQNPDQKGQVLILAGISREGTEAAGKLVVDLPRLGTALQNCGIRPSGPLRHFEMLLRVNIMAGSPNSSEVVACHVLPGAVS